MNKDRPVSTSRRKFLSLTAAGGVATLAGCASNQLISTSESSQSTSNLQKNLNSGQQTASGSRENYTVFSPFKIRNRTLKNRMVRSAAFEAGGTVEGSVKQAMIDIHSSYAAGGVAMTMTGYMSVMEYGKKDTAIGAHDDKFIPELRRLSDAVHAASDDVVFLAEIGHDGSSVVGTMGTPPNLISPTGKKWPGRIGPSGIDWSGKSNGHALTIAEIERFCVDMGKAAARLELAGFDGVEIHGAHHYLINTFISPFTNRRTDKYGGSLENRLRILAESVNEIRKRTGDDFIIAVKLNCDDGSSDNGTPGEITIKNFNQLAQSVEKMGVDAIDISGSQKPGDPMRPGLFEPAQQSFYLPYAQVLEVDIPVILGCGNRDVESLENIINQGDVQFFNFARPLIREPNLVGRWLAGEGPSSASCQSTNLCFRALYDGDGKSVRCIVEEQMQQTTAIWKDLTGLGV